MSNAFSRSWEITKLSFNVMKQDKELLLFPILSGFFSLLFLAVILFPSIISGLLKGSIPEFGAVHIIPFFMAYFVLSFITVFFNVCVVYTTKTRFEGKNATFGESIKFATSKIHLIFMWSLVSASVGMILRLIDNMAQKSAAAGKIIFRIINAILGMMWSIITIFVVPAMVYNGLGPIDSIKKSVEVLKRTWGESLIRYYGLGLVEFLFLIFGFLILILGIIGTTVLVVTLDSSSWVIILIIAIFVLYSLAVIVIFNVVNSIFNTALYVYASTGKIPAGYSNEIMKGAFVRK